MKSQLFKSEVPIHLLHELLNNICERNENEYGEYIVNMESFKKGMYLSLIVPFFQTLLPYYFDSKKKYVEKQNITYNSFTTVLRQLCNFHHVAYTSEIKYYKSNYNIVYKIYLKKLF
jgi:hypothetical protein